jgi:hypothetical protein
MQKQILIETSKRNLKNFAENGSIRNSYQMELLKVTMFIMLMSEIIVKEACSLIQNPC